MGDENYAQLCKAANSGMMGGIIFLLLLTE